MRHPCPQCGRKYDLRSWQLGQEVECPNCQTRFILAAQPTWKPEEGPAPLQQMVVPPEAPPPCQTDGLPGDGPNWTELDPKVGEREDLGRQARIKIAAGMSIPQVRSWLEQTGLSLADVEAILSQLTEAERAGLWARRCAGVALLVGGLISVTLTLVYRPWTVIWVSPWSGTEIDPLVAVGFYWCGGLLAFTAILGFLGMLFGAVMDHTREARKR
jgi:DNA-directed RNA polymerase subunit RPC12/RpoP